MNGARMSGTLAVVVLHHRGWHDTVACLESLARQRGAARLRTILVDNGDDPSTAARAAAWLAGDGAEGLEAPHDTLATHWWPLRGVPGAQWHARAEADVAATIAPGTTSLPAWSYVRAASNRGFAAGMNLGLRVALGDPTVVAAWLLNNDTVVDAGATDAILDAVARDADVGQWGTQLRYVDRPDVVQSDGSCRWRRWTARSVRCGDGVPASALPPAPAGARLPWPAYVYGASWVLRAAAVREVGLLAEDAIVYGEELDWAARARGRWAAARIPAAIVWHREGASAGGRAVGPKSAFADLHGIAARIRLTRRWFAEAWPTVYCTIVAAALGRRFLRRQPARARAILRLLREGDAALPAALAELRAAPVPEP